jgi:2-iminobutanoate/2-iminopropanoate deaminase
MSDVRFLKLAPEAARATLHSDVAIIGDLAFISGQQPIDLADDRVPVPDGLERQAAKIFENLDTLLAAAGMAKRDIVAVRVALVDFERFIERFNIVYARYFGAKDQPARTCLGVSALTRGALVEIDFVLHRRSPATSEERQ